MSISIGYAVERAKLPIRYRCYHRFDEFGYVIIKVKQTVALRSLGAPVDRRYFGGASSKNRLTGLGYKGCLKLICTFLPCGLWNRGALII